MIPNTMDRGRLMAHRGASMVKPENTLAAIREADRQGAIWIEFDVSLLGDGTPVVHHDNTLDRCTNRVGPLSGIGLEDLNDIDAGKGEVLPTLTQVMDLLEELGMFANLEMKPHNVPPAVIADAVTRELTSRSWSNDRIITSSFNHKALEALRQNLPEVPLAVLFDKPPNDWSKPVMEMNAAALHLHFTHLTQTVLREAEAIGVDVRVFTVNTPQVLVPFRGLPLTGIITDHPPLFLNDSDWAAWTRS